MVSSVEGSKVYVDVQYIGYVKVLFFKPILSHHQVTVLIVVLNFFQTDVSLS